jgi:hypothetical protein
MSCKWSHVIKYASVSLSKLLASQILWIQCSGTVLRHAHKQTCKDMSKLLGTCCDYVNAPESEQNMPQHKVYLSTSKSGLNTFQNIQF